MLNVFKFTFVQQLKTKSYKLATVIIAFILFIASVALILIIDKVIDDDKVSDISSVYVYDDGLFSRNDGNESVYEAFHLSENENYSGVKFIDSGSSDILQAAEKAAASGDHSVAMEVSGEKTEKIKIRIVVPSEFAGDKKSADRLADFAADNFRYVVCSSEGLDEKAVSVLTSETETEVITVGEEASKGKQAAKMIAPLAAGFVLYMMLAIYGQNVARGVVLEKDSKIIENLLVIIRPYDILFGKLLGICLFAVFQMAVWVISLIAGVGCGYVLTAGSGSGSSAVNKIFETLGEIAESGTFNAGSVILAVLSLITGFVLFCALAALFGSFASKSDEVPAYFSMYTMIMVVGWIFPYMNGLSGNEHMLNILRYIPFTSPFTVPADVLVGNIGAAQAAVSMAVMIVTAVILIFLAAKVYNALVLYRGTTIKPKEIIKVIKGSVSKSK